MTVKEFQALPSETVVFCVQKHEVIKTTKGESHHYTPLHHFFPAIPGAEYDFNYIYLDYVEALEFAAESARQELQKSNDRYAQACKEIKALTSAPSWDVYYDALPADWDKNAIAEEAIAYLQELAGELAKRGKMAFVEFRSIVDELRHTKRIPKELVEYEIDNVRGSVAKWLDGPEGGELIFTCRPMSKDLQELQDKMWNDEAK